MQSESQKYSHTQQQRRALVFALFVFLVIVVMAVLVNNKSRTISSLPAKLDPMMTYQILNTYPHDPHAFTQGLIFLDGFLYESTGLYGESTLRKVALESGEVLQQTALEGDFFGEGLTNWEETLIQLTWREGVGFIYEIEDFSLQGRFDYLTEGWGLTQDGEHLIMSDGTSALHFLNPETFEITTTLTVTFQGEEIHNLNELEYIRGQVFANIWQTDDVVRIDPETGEVLGWIDLSGILPEEERHETTNVLNGIAYDPKGDRLFITGKRWSKLYEIRLIPIFDHADMN